MLCVLPEFTAAARDQCQHKWEQTSCCSVTCQPGWYTPSHTAQVICLRNTPSWVFPSTGYPPASGGMSPHHSASCFHILHFTVSQKKILPPCSVFWCCTSSYYRFRSLHSFLKFLIKSEEEKTQSPSVLVQEVKSSIK